VPQLRAKRCTQPWLEDTSAGRLYREFRLLALDLRGHCDGAWVKVGPHRTGADKTERGCQTTAPLTCSHGLASRSHPTFNIANTLKLPKFPWKSNTGGTLPCQCCLVMPCPSCFLLSLFDVLRGIALSGQNGFALGRSLDVCQLTARRFCGQVWLAILGLLRRLLPNVGQSPRLKHPLCAASVRRLSALCKNCCDRHRCKGVSSVDSPHVRSQTTSHTPGIYGNPYRPQDLWRTVTMGLPAGYSGQS
jgi:hypothetical protein